MGNIALLNKDTRNCFSCQFWSGKNQVRVKDRNFAEINRDAEGTCNLTGITRKYWHKCGEYEKRNDF